MSLMYVRSAAVIEFMCGRLASLMYVRSAAIIECTCMGVIPPCHCCYAVPAARLSPYIIYYFA